VSGVYRNFPYGAPKLYMAERFSTARPILHRGTIPVNKYGENDTKTTSSSSSSSSKAD
jgi:hypothetical protein